MNVNYSEPPDVEELDDLLARAIVGLELGVTPQEVAVMLAHACFAYTSTEDKLQADLWVEGPAILEHLQASLKQRGSDYQLHLPPFYHALTIYKHTLDCAAGGIYEATKVAR